MMVSGSTSKLAGLVEVALAIISLLVGFSRRTSYYSTLPNSQRITGTRTAGRSSLTNVRLYHISPSRECMKPI